MSDTTKYTESNSSDIKGFDYEKDYDYDNSIDYQDQSPNQRQSFEIVSPGSGPSADKTALFIPSSERSLNE